MFCVKIISAEIFAQILKTSLYLGRQDARQYATEVSHPPKGLGVAPTIWRAKQDLDLSEASMQELV